MRTFTNEQQITSVKRQVYTGALSTLTDLGVTYTAYLRPLSEEQNSLNGLQFGQGFQLITELGIDIRTGDKVTINSVDYTVRGVAVHSRGSAPRLTDYAKYLLVKPEL